MTEYFRFVCVCVCVSDLNCLCKLHSVYYEKIILYPLFWKQRRTVQVHSDATERYLRTEISMKNAIKLKMDPPLKMNRSASQKKG